MWTKDETVIDPCQTPDVVGPGKNAGSLRRRVVTGAIAATLVMVGASAGLGLGLALADTPATRTDGESASAPAVAPERELVEAATADADADVGKDERDDEYEQGYNDGWEEGWQHGWDDGWDDGVLAEGHRSGEEQYDHDHDDHDRDDHGSEEPIATFPVDGDRLEVEEVDATSIEPEAIEQAQAIWDRFAELIPADQRTTVVRFELLPVTDISGHVYRDQSDPTKWVLGIRAEFVVVPMALDHLLLHEFAHILTLRTEEVSPWETYDTCPTFQTIQGCALEGSTILEFVDRFWPLYLQVQLDQEGAWEVFETNPDQFVSWYAATNPSEDLAEVFPEFVLNAKPTADSIADDKIRFLWDDPDMVELRNQIRAAL